MNPRAWGTLLIWLGVLAWAPFFLFLAIGREVSLFPFLAAHLAGVLGGAWLRTNADRKAGVSTTPDHGRWRRLASRIMIYLGVLAWAPYFYLQRFAGQEVEIAPFLAAHLTGVLGGAALQASVEVERWFQQRRYGKQ